MTERLTIRAHAKTNLLLRVLAREESGYHDLETIFALLELHDTVHVERSAGGIELDVQGADTGPAEDNLASRAADLVLEATGRQFGVRITLEKRIPVQAGLGGGSSDGAAVLHAVNALADNAVPRHELLQFAAAICDHLLLLLLRQLKHEIFREPVLVPLHLLVQPLGRHFIQLC